MIFYRVENSHDLTNEEAIGQEINILHRTQEGAQQAIDCMEWDDDWGVEPELEVATIEFEKDFFFPLWSKIRFAINNS